jgi:branched-chain amino acid transport system substrate-binding protein
MAALAAAAAVTIVPQAALAQGTIKIGFIGTFSGQFADAATQMDNGIKLYMQKFGDSVAGRKIEILRRDSGGANPDVAKRLAQELVVRDGVDILAGFVLTPNALAVADVSAQAKKPMIIMNAGTSIVTTKSDYSLRVSMTLPQLIEPFGAWVAKQGTKRAFTMVSDYAPGHDVEAAFHRSFKEAGGEIVGQLRMPIASSDFSAFVQRAKDANPESIFIFVPAGIQPAAIMKSMAERGVTPDKIKILGQGEITDDTALRSAGDAAIGVVTSYHYDHTHNSAMNKEFVKSYRAMSGGINPNLFAVGGYDGMHLIYEALKKTGGKTDGDAFVTAAKGMAWESPRGPMSIDPETRDVVQAMYFRRVEKSPDGMVNVELDKVEKVKDPVKARMGQAPALAGAPK